ncbi:hypothetical protein Q3G72_008130 [Acer saccharum]|nr:hypothetical protein Q3G72_008130 [Acer saccharum]
MSSPRLQETNDRGAVQAAVVDRGLLAEGGDALTGPESRDGVRVLVAVERRGHDGKNVVALDERQVGAAAADPRVGDLDDVGDLVAKGPVGGAVEALCQVVGLAVPAVREKPLDEVAVEDVCVQGDVVRDPEVPLDPVERGSRGEFVDLAADVGRLPPREFVGGGGDLGEGRVDVGRRPALGSAVGLLFLAPVLVVDVGLVDLGGDVGAEDAAGRVQAAVNDEPAVEDEVGPRVVGDVADGNRGVVAVGPGVAHARRHVVGHDHDAEVGIGAPLGIGPQFLERLDGAGRCPGAGVVVVEAVGVGGEPRGLDGPDLALEGRGDDDAAPLDVLAGDGVDEGAPLLDDEAAVRPAERPHVGLERPRERPGTGQRPGRAGRFEGHLVVEELAGAGALGHVVPLGHGDSLDRLLVESEDLPAGLEDRAVGAEDHREPLGTAAGRPVVVNGVQVVLLNGAVDEGGLLPAAGVQLHEQFTVGDALGVDAGEEGADLCVGGPLRDEPAGRVGRPEGQRRVVGLRGQGRDRVPLVDVRVGEHSRCRHGAEVRDHRVGNGRGVRGDVDAGEHDGRVVVAADLGEVRGSRWDPRDDAEEGVGAVGDTGRVLPLGALVERVLDAGDDQVGPAAAAPGGRDADVRGAVVAERVRLLKARTATHPDKGGAEGHADSGAGHVLGAPADHPGHRSYGHGGPPFSEGGVGVPPAEVRGGNGVLLGSAGEGDFVDAGRDVGLGEADRVPGHLPGDGDAVRVGDCAGPGLGVNHDDVVLGEGTEDADVPEVLDADDRVGDAALDRDDRPDREFAIDDDAGRAVARRRGGDWRLERCGEAPKGGGLDADGVVREPRRVPDRVGGGEVGSHHGEVIGGDLGQVRGVPAWPPEGDPLLPAVLGMKFRHSAGGGADRVGPPGPGETGFVCPDRGGVVAGDPDGERDRATVNEVDAEVHAVLASPRYVGDFRLGVADDRGGDVEDGNPGAPVHRGTVVAVGGRRVHDVVDVAAGLATGDHGQVDRVPAVGLVEPVVGQPVEGAGLGGRENALRFEGVLCHNADARRDAAGVVPVLLLRVQPCGLRVAVAVLDVAKAPLDLSDSVCRPVGARGAHFATGEGLGDAVGRRGRVVGAPGPAGFLGPQVVQGVPGPARGDHRLPGGASVVGSEFALGAGPLTHDAGVGAVEERTGLVLDPADAVGDETLPGVGEEPTERSREGLVLQRAEEVGEGLGGGGQGVPGTADEVAEFAEDAAALVGNVQVVEVALDAPENLEAHLLDLADDRVDRGLFLGGGSGRARKVHVDGVAGVVVRVLDVNRRYASKRRVLADAEALALEHVSEADEAALGVPGGVGELLQVADADAGGLLLGEDVLATVDDTGGLKLGAVAGVAAGGEALGGPHVRHVLGAEDVRQLVEVVDDAVLKDGFEEELDRFLGLVLQPVPGCGGGVDSALEGGAEFVLDDVEEHVENGLGDGPAGGDLVDEPAPLVGDPAEHGLNGLGPDPGDGVGHAGEHRVEDVVPIPLDSGEHVGPAAPNPAHGRVPSRGDAVEGGLDRGRPEPGEPNADPGDGGLQRVLPEPHETGGEAVDRGLQDGGPDPGEGRTEAVPGRGDEADRDLDLSFPEPQEDVTDEVEDREDPAVPDGADGRPDGLEGGDDGGEGVADLGEDRSRLVLDVVPVPHDPGRSNADGPEEGGDDRLPVIPDPGDGAGDRAGDVVPDSFHARPERAGNPVENGGESAADGLPGGGDLLAEGVVVLPQEDDGSDKCADPKDDPADGAHGDLQRDTEGGGGRGGEPGRGRSGDHGDAASVVDDQRPQGHLGGGDGGDAALDLGDGDAFEGGGVDDEGRRVLAGHVHVHDRGSRADQLLEAEDAHPEVHALHGPGVEDPGADRERKEFQDGPDVVGDEPEGRAQDGQGVTGHAAERGGCGGDGRAEAAKVREHSGNRRANVLKILLCAVGVAGEERREDAPDRAGDVSHLDDGLVGDGAPNGPLSLRGADLVGAFGEAGNEVLECIADGKNAVDKFAILENAELRERPVIVAGGEKFDQVRRGVGGQSQFVSQGVRPVERDAAAGDGDEGLDERGPEVAGGALDAVDGAGPGVLDVLGGPGELLAHALGEGADSDVGRDGPVRDVLADGLAGLAERLADHVGGVNADGAEAVKFLAGDLAI